MEMPPVAGAADSFGAIEGGCEVPPAAIDFEVLEQGAMIRKPFEF
jgi:hypothetical protein